MIIRVGGMSYLPPQDRKVGNRTQSEGVAPRFPFAIP